MSDTPHPYELLSKRADKAKRNDEISPLELLKCMIHDIETGAVECDGMVISFCLRKPNEQWDFGRYRSTLSKADECMLLQASTHNAMRGWLG